MDPLDPQRKEKENQKRVSHVDVYAVEYVWYAWAQVMVGVS